MFVPTGALKSRPHDDRLQYVGRRVRPTYTFTRRPDGLTDIDVVVVRDGKNLKGRLLGFVLGTIGKRVLEKAFANSVRVIEARNGPARQGRPS